MADVSGTLAAHQWHITRWGDGLGGWGWQCRCGINDWGTGAENPERYRRFETVDVARHAAVVHIALALSEVDVETP